MEKGINIAGWLARGNWTDVGSPRSLRAAEKWKLNQMRYTNISGTVCVTGGNVLGPVQLGDSVKIGQNSRVIGPVSIGRGSRIGENVLIGPYTSLGENCIIENNSKIFSSSLYNHVDIGQDTTVSGSIIDNNASIGERCNVENNTVIGPRVVLKSGSVVHSGTRIWPDVTVEENTIVSKYLLNDDFETSCEGS